MSGNRKKKSSVSGLPDTGRPNIIEEPLRTIEDDATAQKTGHTGKKKQTSKRVQLRGKTSARAQQRKR